MNAIFFENGCALVASERGVITTLPLREGRYVRVDDGKNYPQLCAGSKPFGNTVIYGSDAQMARQCRAKIYKTRKGFERAAERIYDDIYA